MLQPETKTLKILEENKGSILQDIGIGMTFWKGLHLPKNITAGIRYLTKLKSFSLWNNQPDEEETQRIGENICDLHI